MSKEYRFLVSHTTLGEMLITAPDRLTALHRAAREWGTRWTEIARECIICQLGEVYKPHE